MVARHSAVVVGNGFNRMFKWIVSTALPAVLLVAAVGGITGVRALRAQVAAQHVTMNIGVNKPGIKVSPTLWGIFFEEINYAGEGGLWGQMVNNPTLKAVGPNGMPVGWFLSAGTPSNVQLHLDLSHALNLENPAAIRLDCLTNNKPPHNAELVNGGYWGMNFKKGEDYRLTVYSRRSPGMSSSMKAALLGRDGTIVAEKTISGISRKWKKFSVVLKAAHSDRTGQLAFIPLGSGSLYITQANLFSADALKDGGFRPALLHMLQALHPSFMRFPGGNYIEGNVLANGFLWKRTIGPDSMRPGHLDDSWGYWTTDQLGYTEFLNLCKKLKAAPLFDINCGLSLGANDVVPMKDIGHWVRNALDAVQYANGPASSKWGAVRARDGYPKPFGLKYMEIGNEDWWVLGNLYPPRYAKFYHALHKAYPSLKLIYTGFPKLSHAHIQIVDEHYYSSPAWFWANRHMYDHRSRNGPRVFVGEYAVVGGAGYQLRAALAEAAFMAGLERNSDLVRMASYAPLFVNVHYRGWNPDLIEFNSSHVCGTPSYYVQQMYSDNRPANMLPLKLSHPMKAIKVPPSRGTIGVGTWNTQSEYKDIVVTSGGKTIYSSDFGKGRAHWRPVRGKWTLAGGAWRQNSTRTNCISMLDLPALKHLANCTLTLKAKKLGGAEGFLIVFHKNFWWNVGGWRNTQTAVQHDQQILGPSLKGHVQTNKWYTIKIVLHGYSIQCYLDGKLIEHVKFVSPATSRFTAIAGISASGKTVIVKVVNGQREPVNSTLNLRGVAALAAKGTAETLTADSLRAENSIAHPLHVSPKVTTIKVAGAKFNYTFPARSFTILRIKTQ